MATARDKFQVGQRVKMTARALAQGLDGPSNRRTGVVRGFPTRVAGMQNLSLLVRVKRDRDQDPSSKVYHMDFWEADSKEHPDA